MTPTTTFRSTIFIGNNFALARRVCASGMCHASRPPKVTFTDHIKFSP
jgi:hypothetical protein